MDALELHLRSCIQRAGGWLTFDSFMSEVLYAPGLGYYNGDRVVFGRHATDGSDYVTAPELTPLFGRALARQVAQALRATRTRRVLEFGAGSGALASQLLRELTSNHGLAVQYQIVEVSGALRERQRQQLSPWASSVEWLDALPERVEAVIVGNEVLDAMPVKLLLWTGHEWMERGVTTLDESSGGGFRWLDRATEMRPPYEHGRWVPGTVTEIHPYAKAWMQTVGERLARGAIFLVDYGFGDAEYYHPQRIGGTLMCHQAHRSDADPLIELGKKDITAHVNFTAIALTGQDAGLQVLGYTSQAHFLLNCGLLDDLSTATVSERSLAQRLIHEHEMGELFKVLAFSDAEHAFDAIGFRAGDRSHRL